MKLFSGLKAEILTLFFLNQGSSFHVREIARRINKSAMGALYELQTLEDDGILNSTKLGNMRMFTLQENFPGRESLRDLLIGYYGLSAVIKNELAGVQGIIDCFIYGSYADGSFDVSSDVDLFLTGDIDYETLYPKIKNLENRLAVEINPQIMTISEYDKRKRNHDPYIFDIENNQKVYLVHDGKEV